MICHVLFTSQAKFTFLEFACVVTNEVSTVFAHHVSEFSCYKPLNHILVSSFVSKVSENPY